MRVLAVYLTMVLLVLVSAGIGYVLSDWPQWCHRIDWCRPDWPTPAARS